jgi:putative NIF3 family GTP cyclohydrolase 1 type 2
MQQLKKIFSAVLCVAALGLLFPSLSCSHTAADEAREQQESKAEERAEEREEMRRLDTEEQPKTAGDVVEMLKKRVEERRRERRRKELLKLSASAGATMIWESNPASVNTGDKDDPSYEKTFSLNWLPKFNRQFSGNLGYSLTDLLYQDNPTLGTFDQTLTADMTYKTLGGRLHLTPGGSHQWMVYPKADTSSYNQTKSFFRFTHYLPDAWSWGGKYEYAYKKYSKDLARGDDEAEIRDLKRLETRNTVELWIKKFIGKYSLKLKGKSYRNKSNDEFQDFYEYDTHKGEVVVAGSFLKDNKLYMTYTADYEVKQYFERLAEVTARGDNVVSHQFKANYSLTKNFKLNYTYKYKLSSSNVALGEFDNITHKLGLSANF